MKAKGFTVPVYRLKLVKDRTARLPAKPLETSNAAANLLCSLIADSDRENFVAVFLNVGLVPVGVHTICIGGLANAQISHREVFKAAIVANAHSLILGHNHPSGNVNPSEDDVRITSRLVEVSKLLGIPILDHVIVGPGPRFASMCDRGLLHVA